MASFSRTSPAGSPETIATSAGPCDSPAVASSRLMCGSVVGLPARKLPHAAPVPTPQGREQEPRESARLVGIERDCRLCLLAVPDAETRVLRLGQVDGDAQAAVADVRVAA